MSERSYNRALRKYELEDETKMAAAVSKLERDSDLRHFLGVLLDYCGMARDPFTGNALTSAHNAGKMAVGLDMITILTTYAPNFYPELLAEINNEQRARSDALLDRQHNSGND